MKESQEKKITLQDMAKLAWLIIVSLIIMISAISIFIPGVHYYIDLFSHFQLQYFTVLLMLLLAGLLIPKMDRKLIIPVVIYEILLASALFPMRMTAAEKDLIARSDIFFINANYYNENADIAEYIVDTDINTIAIVETNEALITNLTKHYGPPISQEGVGSKTCVIFSNEPNIEYPLDQNAYAYPICTTIIDGTVLVVIHPYPPFGNEYYFAQIEHFEQIGDLLDKIRDDGYNFILMGDFNSSIYSPVFRHEFSEFFKQNNYTWSASLPLMLPIDHAMSNMPIEVAPSKTLSSDHAGLFVDIDLSE